MADRRTEWTFAVVLALVVAIASATSAPWWWTKTFGGDGPPPGVTGFSGGCSPFRVYAQNRWVPLGTALRAAPAVESEQVGSFAPNKVIMVDGWVHSKVAYPTNTPPWNSDVWFHVADDSGWVSFAGVRELPTSPDETGFDPDGGQPVPATASCHGAIS